MDTKGKACALAALVLQDSGIDVTSDGILTILKEANVEIEPIWATIFAKALDGVDVKGMLMNFASAPQAGGAPAAGGQDGGAAEEAKEEEAAEESDEDMGFGLFD